MRSALSVAAVLLAAPAAPHAAEVYVPNEVSGNISVLDAETGEPLYGGRIPAEGSLGQKIQALAFNQDGSTLFVTDAIGDVVLAVDPESGEVREKLPAGDGPEGLSLSPDGDLLAVCAEESDEVVFFDARDFRESHRIPVLGDNPEHCVFSPDGRWLLASNEESHDVEVIDISARKTLTSIAFDGAARGIGFLPDGSKAYVANEGANTVEVIDTDGWRRRKTIPSALRTAGVAVRPDGQYVFVTNGGAHSVSVIDPSSDTIVKFIAVGERPWNMAFSDGGRCLFVANGRSDSISVIDTEKLEVVRQIPVGKKPWGVAVRP